MRWSTCSLSLLVWLLFALSPQGSCDPEVPAPGASEEKPQEHPKEKEKASASVNADGGSKKEDRSQRKEEKANTEVGLLKDDSSAETQRAFGLLERRRAEAAARIASRSGGQPQTESGENREEKEDGEEKKCSPWCQSAWLGDGWCDTACNTKECDFDKGDCEGWCSGDCKPGWPGDGFCDSSCYVEACKWDGGDCEKWKSAGVQPIDRRALQQKRKQLLQHRLQLPDCKCERRLLVNGACTPECDVPECLFDGGECLDMCNAKCSRSWLGDGDCDRDCDARECGFDKGDCDSHTNAAWRALRGTDDERQTCSSSCRLWMIGNGVCDTQCNNIECGFDGGDCDNVSAVLEVDYSAKPEVYQFCAKEWIGDGHCDPNCYNKPSKWDGGDCEGTQFEKDQAAKGIGPQFDK